MNGLASFDDDKPMRPVIYVGKIGILERYRCMGDYSWGLAFPASLLGPEELTPNATHDSEAPAGGRSKSLNISLSEGGPSRSNSLSASRPTPCMSIVYFCLMILIWVTDPKQGKKGGTSRNKFMQVSSPLMPKSLKGWQQASELVGRDFNQDQPSRRGVPRGYFLPEPAILANHSDDRTRQSYFLTFLKLREVLYYRIGASGPMQCLQSPSEWRSILGLELHGSRTDSRAADSRRNLVEKLQESLRSSTNLVHIHFL